jgi:hypothetical protein
VSTVIALPGEDSSPRSCGVSRDAAKEQQPDRRMDTFPRVGISPVRLIEINLGDAVLPRAFLFAQEKRSFVEAHGLHN